MAKPKRLLKRYGHKGQFVKYPPKWQRRMVHTGKRRYDTNCDLLLGVCACGERHEVDEPWIHEMLEIEHCCIESHEGWLKRIRSESPEELRTA